MHRPRTPPRQRQRERSVRWCIRRALPAGRSSRCGNAPGLRPRRARVSPAESEGAAAGRDRSVRWCVHRRWCAGGLASPRQRQWDPGVRWCALLGLPAGGSAGAEVRPAAARGRQGCCRGPIAGWRRTGTAGAEVRAQARASAARKGRPRQARDRVRTGHGNAVVHPDGAGARGERTRPGYPPGECRWGQGRFAPGNRVTSWMRRCTRRYKEFVHAFANQQQSGGDQHESQPD